MTVGTSNASMSEKSRLESLEKVVVHHHRQIRELEQRIQEQDQAISVLDNKIEDFHSVVFQLELKIDSLKSSNEGKQYVTDPNPKV